jgi:A/G-specific adenine glycosylase
MAKPNKNSVTNHDPWRRSIRRRLLAWFAKHARELPWRHSRDVYRVWVSEIMLQQTQVKTVEPYFRRFVAAFPTIVDLAAAEEHAVLRQWEGLGYYRRARHLHAAAKQVVDDHAGQFPRDIDAVRALPGIGRYTAGAILSIAFDDRHPILEANTLRLIARLIGYRGDPKSTGGQRLLWEAAESLLPRNSAGAFNQALMELGSLVCTPKAPQCNSCPVANLCVAAQQGLQDRIPPPKVRPRIEQIREASVVVRRRGRVLVRRCGPNERWAGLWDFPRFEIGAENGSRLRSQLATNVQRMTGVVIRPGSQLATLKHGVTRFRITLECFDADYVDGAGNGQRKQLKWLRPAELANYPLSTTGRKIANLLVGGGL